VSSLSLDIMKCHVKYSHSYYHEIKIFTNRFQSLFVLGIMLIIFLWQLITQSLLEEFPI
jgi:hypothetical protein